MDSLRLAQLMCSRLCHDLITPVGAITTGLEIIDESEGDIDRELMDLTVSSSKNAAQRLVFYRAAFGFSSTASIDSVAAFKQMLLPYLDTYKIKADISETTPISQDLFKDHARLLINLMGILPEVAPYGGDLNLSFFEREECLQLELGLRGDLVGLKSATVSVINGDFQEQDITPHTVQSYLIHRLLQDVDATITFVENSKSNVQITLSTNMSLSQKTGALF